MLTEKELIAKIKELKQIKPQKDWAVSNKTWILGEEVDKGWASVSFFPFLKPALVSLTVFAILFGLFGFIRNFVPGDFLYSIKRITERDQAVFVSEPEQEELQNSLKLANERLEELVRIVETKETEKLASAILETSKSLSEIKTKESDTVAIKDIIEKTKGLVRETRLLGSLTGLGEDEIDGLEGEANKLEAEIAEILISGLEKATLTEEQEELLSQMKELAEEGKYSEVLELYFTSQ